MPTEPSHRAALMIAPLALAAAAVAAPTPAPPLLAACRGHERVLILFAPAAEDARLADQERLLAPAAGGLRERDLRVARVLGDGTDGLSDEAGRLRRRFGVADGAFAVRLIGKDGHVAIRRATPITAAALFATIDAMPMRQDEMRHAETRSGR